MGNDGTWYGAYKAYKGKSSQAYIRSTGRPCSDPSQVEGWEENHYGDWRPAPDARITLRAAGEQALAREANAHAQGYESYSQMQAIQRSLAWEWAKCSALCRMGRAIPIADGTRTWPVRLMELPDGPFAVVMHNALGAGIGDSEVVLDISKAV